MLMMRPPFWAASFGAAAWRDVEDAVEVDVHLAPPLLGLRLEKQLRLDVARVVDDDVETAQLGDDAVDHPAHGGVVGHVGLIGHRATAQLRDLRHERIGVGLRVHVVDGDGGAFASQGQRDLAADVARPPVTSATFPASPRFIASLPGRPEEPEESIGADRQLGDLDPAAATGRPRSRWRWPRGRRWSRPRPCRGIRRA